MEAHPRIIHRYITPEGKVPFGEWLDALQDRKARVKIKSGLDRVELGNLGDYRSVGDGVFELRIDYGPGYRVYFGQIDITLVLILCGGDKSTQEQDISKAKEYWSNYEKRQNADQ